MITEIKLSVYFDQLGTNVAPDERMNPVTARIVAPHELSPATIHADVRGTNCRRRQYVPDFTVQIVSCSF